MRIRFRAHTPRRSILFASAALLFVAAVVVGSLGVFRYWSAHQAESARAESVTAAQRTVESMFSYDYRTVDTELPKVVDNLAGGFRSDYAKIIRESIIPGAKQKQLTVQATATAEGIVSATRNHAVVLLFLNQVTIGKDTPQSTITASRVRVTLDKHDGHWLTDEVTPI